MEVKCFNCLLNLFSMYTFCKILGMLPRCLFSSHQIITTVFTTGILYLFLAEQTYRKILCHRYEIKKGNAGPLLFDTPFSFLSWGICRFLSYWSGHLANLFILISMLNMRIKIDFAICAVTQKVVFPCWLIFIAQKGL